MDRVKPDTEIFKIEPTVKAKPDFRKTRPTPIVRPQYDVAAKPRPVGLPVDYREGYAKLVRKLRLLGITSVAIADIFEVRKSRLYEWMKLVPAFKAAWDAGGIPADAEVAKGLYKRGKGYKYTTTKVYYSHTTGETVEVPVTVHVPPDPSAAKIWLVNRQPQLWREKISQEITGKDGEPLQPPVIVLTPVSPEDT